MTSALSWPSFFFSVLSLFFLSSDGTATSYLGCFHDYYPHPPIRVLPLEMISSNQMTIGLCINHCLNLDNPSMRYAGVEAGTGDECWCGDENAPFSPQIGKQPDTACKVPCPGNSSQTCGADFHIQVYDLMMLSCEIPQFENGLAAPNSGNFAQVRTFASLTCNPGYNLTGQDPRQCIVDNSNVTKWDKEPPECQAYSTTKRPIATESTDAVSQMTSKSANTAAIIAGSSAGAGLLLIVLVIIVIIACIRKRNQHTKTDENHQQETRRENNNNDDQLGTSVTVGQHSDNPLAENMYDHTPTAQPNNSIPLYAVVNQTTPPSVVKMASKRPTDQAYAYTECTINPPTMPNGDDRQPIFADGDVTSGGRDSGWVENNIYARTDNNGGEECVDNAAYATVNRNQETHAAMSDEEKEGWAENSIYVTSS